MANDSTKNRPNPYSDELLERAKSARGAGRLPPPAAHVRLENRLCGDAVELFLAAALSERLVASFEAEGCALCRASASLLVAFVNAELGEAPNTERAGVVADAVAAAFGEKIGSETLPPGLAPLVSLMAYPTRARCVLLPWEALKVLLSRVTFAGAPATI